MILSTNAIFSLLARMDIVIINNPLNENIFECSKSIIASIRVSVCMKLFELIYISG